MTHISALLALIIFFNIIHLVFESRSNNLNKSAHTNFLIKIILILLLTTLVVDRYNHEDDFYKGYISCKNNLQSKYSNNLEPGTKQNIYRVLTPTEIHESYNMYIIKSESEECNQILKTDSNVIYNIGDMIRVSGKSSEGQLIASNSNSVTISFNYDEYIFYKYHADKIFETFNSRSWLANLSTLSKTETKSSDNNEIRNSNFSFTEKVLYYKNLLSKNYFINHNIEVGELLSGMTLGTNITQSKSLKSDLQNSGLTHIAVMSGYNVVLMSLIIYAIFKFINLLLGKVAGHFAILKLFYLQKIEIRIIVSLLLLSILPIMNDFDAPITRAYIFIFIASLYTLSGRAENYKYIFFVTLLIIILYSPHRAMWDVGLHLSSLAVGSLIFFEHHVRLLLVKIYITVSSLIKIKLSKKKGSNIDNVKFHKLIEEHIITKYFSSTIAAQILVAPYIMYVFGTWHLSSIMSNIFVGFILPPITILALIENIIVVIAHTITSSTILSSTFLLLAKIISLPLDALTNYVLYISSTFSN